MILQVLPETHAKLRRVAVPADPSKAHHKTLARRLVETMNAHKALGIAANQVNPGELVRIIAVNIKEYKSAMFNPEIIEKSTETISIKEGCLSRKDQVVVPRAQKITVRFWDIAGVEKTLELQDLSAIVVQHEIDHLNGILTSDYI